MYIIDKISFRDKGNGWKNYGIIIYGHYESELKKSDITLGRESPYLQALFYNLHLRPICYSCPFKQCKSYSDITIADYWGIHINHPEMDDNKGTSMVFLNTIKGISHFPLNKTIYLKTEYEENLYFNNIITSVKKHRNRDKFYAKIDKCKSIKKLLTNCTFPLSYRIMEITKYVLSRNISKKNYHKLEAIWRKAKKIVMVTFTPHLNFGTCLQSFALNTVLKKMGHDVVFIYNNNDFLKRDFNGRIKDFIKIIIPHSFVEYYWKLKRSKTANTNSDNIPIKEVETHYPPIIKTLPNARWAYFMSKVPLYATLLKLYKYRTRQWRKIYSYTYKDGNYNMRRIYTLEQYEEIIKDSDIFITGSDQIWNPYCCGFDPFMFLEFVKGRRNT